MTHILVPVLFFVGGFTLGMFLFKDAVVVQPKEIPVPVYVADSTLGPKIERVGAELLDRIDSACVATDRGIDRRVEELEQTTIFRAQ